MGGYRLEAVIARGSTGTVYRARRVTNNEVVALKRAPPHATPAMVDRLRREATVLASLDHPHIVRVLELVADGAGVAIAMENAAGGSLATLLATDGPLTDEEVVSVAGPIADALACAHRRGLVHGDVKPANILFTSGGQPLLCDFGAARPPGRSDAGSEAMGTAGYVDPAVREGAPPDECSDVYGLGAVCHEMLTGRPPPIGGGPTVVSVAPVTPPALAAVLARALAPRPADRYAGAEAMAGALRGAVRGRQPDRLRRQLNRGVDRAKVDSAGALPAATPAALTSEGPPTRSFGPRPPQSGPPRAPGPSMARKRPLVLSAAVALTAVAVGAVVVTATGTRRPTVTPCPPVPGPLQADVDGDGCPSAVGWSGNVLEVEGHRYRLGEPGDIVLLGDWDCDGRDTPALYRPVGTVFYFDGWAQDGRPLPAASRGEHLPEGQPEVRRGDDGCDRLVVR